MDFRDRARKCLERAKPNIDTGESSDLRYAALELRMALEALIYEKAKGYVGELPERDINIWQPPTLLKKLIEIDPNVEFDTSFSAGIQEEVDKPAKELTYFGTERVLTLTEIKTFYNRLGSYLHMPTVDQINNGKIPSKEKIETNCKKLVEILEQVLSSAVFNVETKHAIDWKCIKCENKIIRRIPFEKESFLANCPFCIASYSVNVTNDDSYKAEPLLQKLICSNDQCKKENSIWQNGLGLHKQWECSDCKTKHIFMLTSYDLDLVKKKS